jgi:hypothetical protein
MPVFLVNASIKQYFDREVAVDAASEDDAVQRVQEMVRGGQIPLPQLPDEIDGWETGELDVLSHQIGGGFWSAYQAKSDG